MFGFGVWEVILILALLILLFGARKIPELGRGLGAAIRNFKGEIGQHEDDDGGPGELPGSDDRGER